MTVACPFSLERTGHPSDHRSLHPDVSVYAPAASGAMTAQAICNPCYGLPLTCGGTCGAREQRRCGLGQSRQRRLTVRPRGPSEG